MKRLLQPSLSRRLVLSLCLAFLLVWCTLLAYTYLRVRFVEQTDNPALAEAAQQILDALEDVDSTAHAGDLVSAFDRMASSSRRRQAIPGGLGFQLWDRQSGLRVYSSAVVAGVTLPGATAGQSVVRISGDDYYIVSRQSPRWSIRVAQERIDRGFILRDAGKDLVQYLLIAFPIVVIPSWIAVRLGLRPLKRLSARLGARSESDLSPLAFEARHAELRPVVAALDDLLGRLNATLARERAFLDDAAHELRTPLAVISAQAHAVRETCANPASEEAIVRLESAVKRSARVTRQLLDLAHLDAPGAVPNARVDIANRIREILGGLEPAASSRQVELTFEGPDHLETLIDAPALESCVTNLADNAIRYGRDQGTVSVVLSGGAENWNLTVADDGPGIAPELRPQMFERFVRGRQDVCGSGLGLAIVRQAAQRLSCELSVGDGPGGRGLSITLRYCSPEGASPAS